MEFPNNFHFNYLNFLNPLNLIYLKFLNFRNDFQVLLQFFLNLHSHFPNLHQMNIEKFKKKKKERKYLDPFYHLTLIRRCCSIYFADIACKWEHF